MDIVQDTVVKLTYTINDLDTGQLTDPDDTTVTVTDVSGNTLTQAYSQNQIYRMSQGKYRAKIDTSLLAIGGCVFEITITGVQTDEVKAQGEFNVVRKLSP